ncbi:metallophosphoesterase family protein [Pacificibacter maritimus]|uniref:metallophosphoesterase family protein n=1 Tax=Pacificibacter maritimus TaxID=762213 RepID=UPI000F4D8FE0|nr:metallophosphoesterase [Pacificibacter maritimus]
MKELNAVPDQTIPFNSGRIAVLGDLHLDHWQRIGRNPLKDFQLEALLRTDFDALIVAGDLINGPWSNWPQAIEFLAQYIPPERIYALPGNHDYYRGSLMDDPDLAKVTQSCSANFVQETVLYHGKTRILCCTLWTDFALLGTPKDSMRFAAKAMNDYRWIALNNNGHEAIVPKDVLDMHIKQRAWLERHLASPHPAGPDGKTIVVTHHGPHPMTAGNIDKLTPAFHSDLSDILTKHPIDAWFFGHSHRHFRETVAGCDIRNVSIGYPEDRQNQLGHLETASIWESNHGPQ